MADSLSKVRGSQPGNLGFSPEVAIRPQSLYLNIDSVKSKAFAADPKDYLLDSSVHENSTDRRSSSINISDTASDSSRSSTPTPSITSSTDDSLSSSSISTPILERNASPPSFILSPPDNARQFLRDRYLESQRPVILRDVKHTPQSLCSEKPTSTLQSLTYSQESSAEREKYQTQSDSMRFTTQSHRTDNASEQRASWEAPHDVEKRLDEKDEVPILKPTAMYELDHPKNPTRLGSGAWSNVYKGYLRIGEQKQQPGLVIAVKRPLNTFAVKALRREAIILSHVQLKISATLRQQSIIPFHGFDETTSSILMTAYSGQNLEQFTSRHRQISASSTTLTARKLPVVGVTQWLFFCERLISALSFLKKSGVLHGDVKPQNVLTKAWTGSLGYYGWISEEEEKDLVEPILSDFSSAYIVDKNGSISDDEEAINAVTTIYCAPELLAAFLTPPTTPTKSRVRQSSAPNENNLVIPISVEPRPLPTFESDVYSLGITLLQTAIGDHPYSAARMEIQKNMWARQGDPVAFARADERVFRCRKGGIVDRLVHDCFGKTVEGRATIEELDARINIICEEWKEKKGSSSNIAWVWGG